MKKLNFEQMVQIEGGASSGAQYALDCAGAAASGISVLAGLALGGGPIGIGIAILGGIGLAISILANGEPCKTA